MLPNHAPLVIAEQFGTLAELHPGRIDLGARPRARHRPGHDAGAAPRRRRPTRFPQDVRRAAGLPQRREPDPGACTRSPASGTNVPLYILGSSLFGAQLAADARPPLRVRLALRAELLPRRSPPTARVQAVGSSSSAAYVIAGVGVIAAESAEEAAEQLEATRRARARNRPAAATGADQRGGRRRARLATRRGRRRDARPTPRPGPPRGPPPTSRTSASRPAPTS